MDAANRHLCLKSILESLCSTCGSLSQAQLDALELEHAAYVLTQGCPIAYSYAAQRAIHLVAKSKLQILRREGRALRSYVQLLALPSQELFVHLPCQEACAHASALKARGEALLRDLSSSDFSHVPDAGIRCAKCRSSDISFDFLQTRSADEGTTVYCTCTVCGKRWKM
jgi:hypothetical protein